MFSTGLTTGLVAEAGDGVTYTAPVFEGYALPHAMFQMQVSGRDITEKLLNEIRSQDDMVKPEYFEFIRDIKE